MSRVALQPEIWPRRLWAVVRLARPLNVLMFAAGVTVGGLLAGGIAVLSGERGVALALAALSAALIGGAANSFNDICDLAIDRVNRPRRPLPAGHISVGTAGVLWALLTAAGIVLGAWVSAGQALLAAGAAMLLVVYSLRLKRRPFAGNLVVALVVALALVYGGWAVGSPLATLAGASFAFLTTLAREIVKDIEDQLGDSRAGSRTLPLTAGARAAFGLAASVVAGTILLTPLPFLMLGYSGLFLLLVLFTDVLLLRVLVQLGRRGRVEGRAAAASRLLKGAMALGLVALGVA